MCIISPVVFAASFASIGGNLALSTEPGLFANSMTPPILASAADLLQAYDVLFCDVWGVVHNGQRAYAEAGEALARFRAGGGTVILVSNAPVPAAGVERVLDKTGARRDAWDAIVSPATSPCATSPRRATAACIGRPAARDRSLFSRLPGPHARWKRRTPSSAPACAIPRRRRSRPTAT
jgi:hypothetical protein